MRDAPDMLLNGTILPAAEARVPVTDRGFRFGDGVFETIRLHKGVPYQWEAHLARLSAGLVALKIDFALDWQKHARALLNHNAATEGFLRLSVTRGSGSRGYLPTEDATPTWLIETLPPSPAPSEPCRLVLSSITKPPLSSLPTNQKIAQGLNSTLALLDATERGGDDALQLSADERLCEAASANLFWIEGNTLYTPTLETGCLAGTTRARILELAKLDRVEVNASLGSLRNADAVFLTNSRVGVWPVASLAPQGWEFNTTHPAITTLREALDADRDAHTTNNREVW